MTTTNQVSQAAKEYYNDITIDDYGRYRSWEHCYYAFYQACSDENADPDYLSLQLAFYLAAGRKLIFLNTARTLTIFQPWKFHTRDSEGEP